MHWVDIEVEDERFLPKKAHESDAGFDLKAALESSVVIEPKQRVVISCGFKMALPLGFEAQIRPRSGLSTKGWIHIPNAPGTIDQDYRGTIKIVLHNLGKYPYTVEPEERIAQMVIKEVPTINLKMVDSLPPTERGQGGFGSSGRI